MKNGGQTLALPDGRRYLLVPDERATYGYRFYIEDKPPRPYVEVPPPKYTTLLGVLLDGASDDD